MGPRLNANQIILVPCGKPFPNCQLASLLENPLPNLRRDLPELLGNLGLGLAGNGVLLLLSRFRVETAGIAALPVGVLFAVLLNNLFSNGAVARGGPSAFLPRGMIVSSFRRPAGITLHRKQRSGVCPGRFCTGPAL